MDNIFVKRKEETGISYTEIGRLLGDKNRGTASSQMNMPWRISIEVALILGDILGIPEKEVRIFWKAERLKKFKEKLEET